MSCRQLSPQVALALFLVLLLTVVPPASAAATVSGLTVTTDRPTYYNATRFNHVVATANLTFNGNGNLDPVRFEWYYPGASTPFLVRYVPATQMTNTGQATDSWDADRTGLGYRVTGKINQTVGGPAIVSGSATFDVLDRSAAVDVSDIVVMTTSTFYEIGTVARARADLVWSGIKTYIGDVRFDWYYPDWSPAYTSTYPNSIVAWSNWTVDREGNGYHINVSYLPKPSVRNTTYFDVIPSRVAPGGWLPSTFPAGRVVLSKSGGPYGICNNTTVPSGTELVVSPGTVVRFCRNAGLFVNGTLRVDVLPPAERVFFVSYDNLTEAGYWQGIKVNPTATPDSTLFNAVVRGATVGVKVQVASMAIINDTIENASSAAIWLMGSSAVVGNTTVTGSDIGIRVASSTGAVLDANQVRGGRIGILVEGSTARLRSNLISGATQIGFQAVQSTVELNDDTVRDCGDSGVSLQSAARSTFRGLTILGANDSFRADGSANLIIDQSVLRGARLRALYLTSARATVINTTLSSTQWDIQLVSSPTTLINSTYASLYTPVDSTLVVQNFLHVLVESALPALPRIAGATVNVSADGSPVASLQTSGTGIVPWILLTDRVIDSTHTIQVTNTVDVAVPGFTIGSSPRVVDMSTSHLERFVATRIPVINSPSPGINPLLLVLLVAALGGVLVAMPAVRRWRQNGNGKPRTLAHEVVLEPGTAYLLADEKPDRAFQVFESQLAKGAKGLVVTRIYPDEVHRRYRMNDVPVLWLSRGYRKGAVNPTNLGAIIQDVEKFVSGKEDSVVLFDGIEYLLVQNDAQKVVKFVQSLVDTASLHRTKVLLPFNSKAVSEAQAALLTRDLRPL